MKSFIFGLSLASLVLAQLEVAAPPVDTPVDVPVDGPVETGTSTTVAAFSEFTQPPVEPINNGASNFYERVPYSAFQGGRYQELECGYGYKKSADRHCEPESWVRLFFIALRTLC